MNLANMVILVNLVIMVNVMFDPQICEYRLIFASNNYVKCFMFRRILISACA